LALRSAITCPLTEPKHGVGEAFEAVGVVVAVGLRAASVVAVVVMETLRVGLTTAASAVSDGVALGWIVAVGLAVAVLVGGSAVAEGAGVAVSVGFTVGEASFWSAGGAVGAGLTKTSQAVRLRRQNVPMTSVRIRKGRADDINEKVPPVKQVSERDAGR
jgi:hypothetical protein